MKNINEIFYNGQNQEKKNQIKEVKVDWVQHSNGVLNIAKTLVKDYKINETNKEVFKLLLLYFTGNPEFLTEFKKKTGVEGSFNKGIMLIGTVGTGKSLFFEIFKNYTRNIIRANSFQAYTSLDIIDSVNVSGASFLEKFNHNFFGNKAKPLRVYIDDIAAKNETVKNYGTEINVIEQLLSIRYNVFQRYGTLTHCTTNKYPSELVEVYDVRTVDRMKEMFNIIELKGKSFRM